MSFPNTKKLKLSPILLRLTLIISFAEILIMMLFALIDIDLSITVEALLDAGLLTLISAPFIYLLIIKPHIQETNGAQKENRAQQIGLDAHSLVSITDIKGNITFVNKMFCDVSGYSAEELIGSDHSILNSENQPSDYWRKMYLSVSKGNIWHDRVRNKSKNGDFYWVDSTIIGVFLDNKLSGYTSIRTDITSNVEQEKKLLLAKEKAELDAENLLEAKLTAESAAIAKSQFLATMSHEIRTPMNGVIGMAHLLADTELNDEQKDYLRTIIRSGDNLLSIINDILDFSKLEAEMIEFECIPFDFERLCSESLKLVQGNNQKDDVEFIFDYAPDCPRHFEGDPSRLRQVLMNLLGNASKFTETGYIRIGVSSEGSEAEIEKLKLEVQDTGIGLKPKEIKNLFTEFSQADNSTTRKYGGTGLGLSITKKLVALLGGNIGIDSKFGDGTTFWMTFSLPKINISKPVENNSLHDARILFVDDKEEVCLIYKKLLEHMHAVVTIETDPLKVTTILDKAIENNQPYDIAIIDYYMPEKNGLELGTDIRNNQVYSDLKLLALSSLGNKGDTPSFNKAGFNGYLNKLNRYSLLKEVLSRIQNHKTGSAIITQHSIEDSKLVNNSHKKEFKGKILLVDDIIANQIIGTKFLSKLGLDVIKADNGQEAVDLYNENNFELIFMDCRMPVLDGYKATVAIRILEQAAGKKPIPIIALTANATTEDRVLCTDAGMDDIVTKPFKLLDLSDCLEKWLPIPTTK